MESIAREIGTTAPRIALFWVQNRPGVTSTIIGARTMAQLDDNVGALDVKLTLEYVAALDKASTPTFSFPADMLLYGSALETLLKCILVARDTAKRRPPPPAPLAYLTGD
jgi:hypothetical protein